LKPAEVAQSKFYESGLGKMVDPMGNSMGMQSITSDPFGIMKSHGGGLMPRHGYATDGEVVSDNPADKLNPEVERILGALKRVESSGRYDAVGPETRTGDRAHGAYQVMGQNVGPWTEAAFGQRMTPEEFRSSPKAQDAVARHQVGLNLERYGNPQDVASVWFSGRPVSEAGNSSDVTGTTTPEYLRRFTNALGATEGGLGASNRNYLSDIKNVSDRGREREERAGLNFEYPRQQRQQGDWMQRNQDWLVPILSGLGAMASSPSRYLGSAILQGLAGGATQYAGMQNRGEEQDIKRGELQVAQEQARTSALREETAQQQAALQVLDAFDRRYRRVQGPDGRAMFIDQTGGSPLTAEQHAQQRSTLFNALMSGRRGATALAGAQTPTTGSVFPPVAPQRDTQQPEPSVPAATPSTQPQVAPPPAQTPSQPSTQTTSQPPVDPERQAALAALRPFEQEVSRIEERMNAGRAQGFEPSAQDLELLKDARKHLNDLRYGREPIVLPNGDRINYFVRQQAEAASSAQDIQRRQEATNEAVKKTREEAQSYLSQTYPEAHELLSNMANLRQYVETNRGSQLLATLAGYGSQIPWVGEWIQQQGGALQAAVDAGNKEAVQQAFRTLAESAATRAPATGLREALMTVANTEVSPGAAYMMITNTMGRNEQQRAFYEAWLEAGQPDPLLFSQRWQRENPLHNFVQRAVDQTPYFAGMNDEQRRIMPVKRSDDPLREEQRPASQPGASGNQIQEQATRAFGAYEPDKYEYGVNPQTGRFARRPIAGGQ